MCPKFWVDAMHIFQRMSELFLLVLKFGDFLVFDLKGRYKKMSVYCMFSGE
jgi:hypothetical protein